MSRKYRLNNTLCVCELQPHQYRLPDIFPHSLQPESVQEFFISNSSHKLIDINLVWGKKKPIKILLWDLIFLLLPGPCVSWVANLKVKAPC